MAAPSRPHALTPSPSAVTACFGGRLSDLIVAELAVHPAVPLTA